jgi:WD40 repeat protein
VRVLFDRPTAFVLTTVAIAFLATVLATSQTGKSQVIQTLVPKDPLKNAYNNEVYLWCGWATDANVVAATTGDRITIWSAEDVAKGFEEVLSLKTGVSTGQDTPATLLSAKGDLLAYLNWRDNAIHVLKIPSGEKIHSIEAKNCWAICISQDASLIAAAYRDDGQKVRVYSLAEKKWVSEFAIQLTDLRAFTFVGKSYRLACGGEDEQSANVRVFDVSSGKELSKSLWQKEDVISLGSSNDASTLVSVSNDESVKIFSVREDALEVRHTIKTNSPRFVRCAPRNSRVMISHWGRDVQRCNVESGEIEGDFPISRLDSVAISPDGDFAVAIGRGHRYPCIMDLNSLVTPSPKAEQFRIPQNYEDSLDRIRFDVTGQSVGFEDRYDAIKIFSRGQEKVVAALVEGYEELNGNEIHAAAISDRMDVLYEHDGEVKIWSPATKKSKVALRFPEEEFYIDSLAWTSANKYAVGTRRKKGGSELFILDETGAIEQRIRFEKIYSIDQCNVSPDGRWIVVKRGSTTTVYDNEKKSELGEFSIQSKHIAFSPDSRYVIFGQQMLDVTTGELKGILPLFASAQSLPAVSKQGNLIAIGEWETGRVHVWNYLTGELLVNLEQPDVEIQSIAFSPKADALAASTKKGRLLFWKLPPGLADANETQSAPVIQNAAPTWSSPLEIPSESGVTVQISAEGELTQEKVEAALQDALSRIRSGEIKP